MNHINPMYLPAFFFNCSRCNRSQSQPSDSGMCGDKPFTYVCWFCLSDEQKQEVRLEASRQFRALSAAQRYAARVALMGRKEADAATRRERQ